MNASCVKSVRSNRQDSSNTENVLFSSILDASERLGNVEMQSVAPLPAFHLASGYNASSSRAVVEKERPVPCNPPRRQSSRRVASVSVSVTQRLPCQQPHASKSKLLVTPAVLFTIWKVSLSLHYKQLTISHFILENHSRIPD